MIHPMHEPHTQHLEGCPTFSSLAPVAKRVVARPDCRSPGRQQRSRQSVDGTCPGGRPRSHATWATPWGPAATERRTRCAGGPNAHSRGKKGNHVEAHVALESSGTHERPGDRVAPQRRMCRPNQTSGRPYRTIPACIDRPQLGMTPEEVVAVCSMPKN